MENGLLEHRCPIPYRRAYKHCSIEKVIPHRNYFKVWGVFLITGINFRLLVFPTYYRD
jgi:hypothetical protein